MNSHSTRPGGVSYTNTLVRIGTGQGVEGVMDYSQPDPEVLQAAKTLVGADRAGPTPIVLAHRWQDLPLSEDPTHPRTAADWSTMGTL
jgi:hypothetical protein